MVIAWRNRRARTLGLGKDALVPTPSSGAVAIDGSSMEVKFDFYPHHLTAHGTNRASYQTESRGGCLAGPSRLSGRAGGNARPLLRQGAASCCPCQLSGPNSIHKETVMSSITSLSPTSAAFPPVNTHARGHK